MAASMRILGRMLIALCLCSNTMAGTRFDKEDPNNDWFVACTKGDIATMRNLLNSKSNIANVKDTKLQQTCFHNVKTIEAAELLLSKGGDINLVDDDGVPPLSERISDRGSDDLILWMIERANINLADNDKQPPFFYAVMLQNKVVAKRLLEKGVDINLKMTNERTPLLTAARGYIVKDDITNQRKYINGYMIEWLLENGADVNAKDKTGQTALHYCAFNGNWAGAELLLKRGLDKNAKNSKGKTPYDIAMHKKGFVNFAIQLRDFGVKKNLSIDNTKYLFTLSKYSKTSANRIQAYINIVSSVGNFSDYIGPQMKDLARMNITPSFEIHFSKLDNHLASAKENSALWEVQVYPKMRQLFDKLGRFGKDFVDRYAMYESNFRTLKNGSALTQAQIDAKIEAFKQENEDYYDGSELDEKIEELKKKLSGGGDYATALDNLMTIALNTLHFANIYEKEADDMLTVFEKFKQGLNTDQKSFTEDLKEITNLSTESQKKFQEKIMKPFDNLTAEIGYVNDNLRNIQEAINSDFATTRAIGIASMTMQGLGQVSSLAGLGFNGGAYGQKKYDSWKNKQSAKAKSRKNFRRGRRQATRGKKQLQSRGAKKLMTQKGGKSSGGRFAKTMKVGGAVANVAGTVMGVANFVMGIVSMVQQEASRKFQEEQNKRQQEQINRLKDLTMQITDISLLATTVKITSESKFATLETLKNILGHVEGAIKEAAEVRDYWQKIGVGVNDMKNRASSAKDSNDRNRMKQEFLAVNQDMQKMRLSWQNVSDNAALIAGVFNTQDAENPVDLTDGDVEPDAEKAPDAEEP